VTRLGTMTVVTRIGSEWFAKIQNDLQTQGFQRVNEIDSNFFFEIDPKKNIGSK